MGTKKLVKAGEPQKPQTQADLGDQLILFERWLVNNWRKIAIYAGIVLVILIAWGVVTTVNKSIENKAETAFVQAKDAAEIEALMAEHGDTDAANYYRIIIAADAVQKGDLSKAIDLYMTVAASAPDTALKATVLSAAGALYEKTGDLETACNTYASVATDGVYAPSARTEAAYQAGRIALALDKKTDAREFLTLASTIGNNANIYGDMATQLLQTIGQ